MNIGINTNKSHDSLLTNSLYFLHSSSIAIGVSTALSGVNLILFSPFSFSSCKISMKFFLAAVPMGL